MGMVHLGAPFDIIPNLANLCGIRAFVETGTLFGGTARMAAHHFNAVYTIERSESLYQKHHQSLRATGKIEPLFGDSRTILPDLVSRLENQPAMFWLDGHWSGGETAGEKDECPLLTELQILRQRRGDIILIDDARLFLSAPAAPHDPSQWPTLMEISRELDQSPSHPFVQIIDDVIFVVPPREDVKKAVIEYGRKRANAFWAAYEKGRPKRSLARKVVSRLAKMAPPRE